MRRMNGERVQNADEPMGVSVIAKGLSVIAVIRNEVGLYRCEVPLQIGADSGRIWQLSVLGCNDLQRSSINQKRSVDWLRRIEIRKIR